MVTGRPLADLLFLALQRDIPSGMRALVADIKIADIFNVIIEFNVIVPVEPASEFFLNAVD